MTGGQQAQPFKFVRCGRRGPSPSAHVAQPSPPCNWGAQREQHHLYLTHAPRTNREIWVFMAARQRYFVNHGILKVTTLPTLFMPTHFNHYKPHTQTVPIFTQPPLQIEAWGPPPPTPRKPLALKVLPTPPLLRHEKIVLESRPTGEKRQGFGTLGKQSATPRLSSSSSQNHKCG